MRDSYLARPVAGAHHHPHVLHAPGAGVDRRGQGSGTAETHDFAFEQPRNPVSVAGGSTCGAD